MSKENQMSFAALDLECATSDTGNICEIGLVIFEGGQEIRKFRSLVRPVVESFGDWQRWNFDYTLNDTLRAPSFADVWFTAKSLIGDLPVVAHNATEVECKHLGHAFSFHGLDALDSPTFYCTLQLARAQWPDLPKHGIKYVAKHFGWELDHHNPESDARVCGSIVQESSIDRGITDWSELANSMRLHPHRIPQYHTKLSASTKPGRALQRSDYLHELVAWEPTAEIKSIESDQQFVLSGFEQARKSQLRKAGLDKGLVYKRYLKGAINFVVADERMGAAKYAKCQAQEIPILTQEQFEMALQKLDSVN